VAAKVLRAIYRLIVPGGLVLLVSALAMQSRMPQGMVASFWHFYPYIIFGVGLLLSALFNCSRLFFALLVVALSDRALFWLVPRLSSAGIHQIIFDAIALLLPLNLLAFSFMRDRGIISPRGRRRVAFIAAQVAFVGMVVLIQPLQVRAAGLMQGKIIPKGYSEWSHLSQPALLVFVVTGIVMLVYLLDRRRPVESGLFWALVTAFIALNAGGANHFSSVYFASGGLILGIAVLETSYTMAYHDDLTQLPSRRALNQALMKVGDAYTVAMVDVDHFKQFNDTYGHETGDQVLRMIASRLADVTGGGKAYRYGGEEFAVIFPNKSADEAFSSLETLRKKIESTPFKVRGAERRERRKRPTKRAASPRIHAKKRVRVTVSIGAASCDGDARPADEVIQSADKALYRAKESGRNCTVVSG
jgi:diguanylate cyclase (GGDEF)-like protein